MRSSKSALNVPKIITPDQSPCEKFSSRHGFYLDVPSAANDSTFSLSPGNDNNVDFSTGSEPDGNSLQSNHVSMTHDNKRSSSRGSALSELIKHSDLVRRTSHVMLDIPVENVKKIANTKSVNSIDRETKHFAGTTTMHGPKRMYFAKGWGIVFWIFMVTLSFIFLMLQVGSLVSIYLSRPVVSQVSFLIDDEGMPFPDVTLCNFNPIRRSYITAINKTGDFSIDLLHYLTLYDMDAQFLYGSVSRHDLHMGQTILDNYVKNHPNFTVDEFYMEAGFDCDEVLKYCSIGGRVFNCCTNAISIRTNFGKCYTLRLQSSASDWMHRQMESGVDAGIQIIVDAHLEEQFGTGIDGDMTEPLFANGFENGFRYYVHTKDTIPYLSADGISISPNAIAYTSLSTNKYVLLSRESWGNCSDAYPKEYAGTSLPYSMANCQSICKAKYFTQKCGCTPSLYNIDESFSECTPFETFLCIDQHLRIQSNDSIYYASPDCSECKLDCLSTTYQTYNSYGQGLSNGALYWLSKKNPTWTIAHMKQNFGIVNIFFSEMTYTEYSQVQATSLTEILSDIGGNMGMFLGMSVITITEICMFFSKLLWIFVSKKRREYMSKKKANEREQEKKIEEVMTGFKLFRSRKQAAGSESMNNWKGLLAQQSIRTVSPTELDIAQLAWEEAKKQNATYGDNLTENTQVINEEPTTTLRQLSERLIDERKTHRSMTIDNGKSSSIDIDR